MSLQLAVVNSDLNDLCLFFSFVCCSSNVPFEVGRPREDRFTTGTDTALRLVEYCLAI